MLTAAPVGWPFQDARARLAGRICALLGVLALSQLYISGAHAGGTIIAFVVVLVPTWLLFHVLENAISARGRAGWIRVARLAAAGLVFVAFVAVYLVYATHPVFPNGPQGPFEWSPIQFTVLPLFGVLLYTGAYVVTLVGARLLAGANPVPHEPVAYWPPPAPQPAAAGGGDGTSTAQESSVVAYLTTVLALTAIVIPVVSGLWLVIGIGLVMGAAACAGLKYLFLPSVTTSRLAYAGLVIAVPDLMAAWVHGAGEASVTVLASGSAMALVGGSIVLGYLDRSDRRPALAG